MTPRANTSRPAARPLPGWIAACVAVGCILTATGCRKAPDPGAALHTLEEAIRAHDYYFKQEPPIPASAYEKAAAAIAPGQAWNPASPPADQLAALLAAVPSERRAEAWRRAFNTLLSAGNPDETPGRRNYYVGADTDARLNDKENVAGAGLVLYREPGASGRFRIVDVLEGSPAHVAGIPQGAVIESVDGQSLADRELEDVVALIRGKTGTSIQIRADQKDYTLVRGLFGVQLLRRTQWDVNEQRLLYVELRSVAKGASRDIENVLMKASKIDGLILDLRKLNQGDVEESFRVADLFVSGKTLAVVHRRGVAPRAVQADGNVQFTGPVYVLVSARTSSHLRMLAMGLRQSSKVIFIGPDMPLEAYVAGEVPLDGKGEAGHVMIVESVIAPEGDARLQPEVIAEDYIPVNPPSTQPNPNDPVHAALLKKL